MDTQKGPAAEEEGTVFNTLTNHNGQEYEKEYTGLPCRLRVKNSMKNSPANAGDTGLIPGPGRSHVPRSKHNYWSLGA